MNHRYDLWPPSRIDRLRTLVARMVARPGTMTCRDIGEDLGVTKNAVIGKVKRLRAEGDNIPHLKPVAYIGRPQQGVRPRSPRPRMSTLPKPRPGLPPPEPVVPFTMRRLSLMQLGDRTCRWPIGDEAPFLFCGNPTDPERVYCPVHHSVAHGKP